MVMMFLSILIPSLLGLLTLGILLRRDTESGPLLRLGMSFPLGMGLITTQMFFLGLLRVPLALPYVAILPLSEIALLALAAWRLKARILPPAPHGPTAPRPWPFAAAGALVACWVMLKLGSVFVETMLRPIYAWDSWADWSATAKTFYYSRSLLLDAPSQDFFGKGIIARIIQYPLHNALSQIWFAQWAGGFDEVLVKSGSPVMLLCLSAVMFSIGRKVIGTFFALLVLVIFLSSPLLSYHAIEVYSDMLLGTYIALTTASFLLAMRKRSAFWPLVGFFAALALFTKDEAPFFVLPLLVSAASFILAQAGAGREQRQRSLLSLFFPLLLVAPWFLFKLAHGIGFGAIDAVLTFKPVVVWQMITQLISLDNFFVVPVFFVVFLMVSGRPTREFLHLALPLACYAAFFAAVYCLTTFYYVFFSNGTVFFRNVLTWYPSVCLLIILFLERTLPAEWRGPTAAAERP